jgi:2-phospho-L-lactate transferase/gluconeogenesis factor (CofD/UPF0052 family)
LINNPRVELTVAINGYDDGASTGEVRRLLGDALGPSDYRKNASRFAHELRSCPPALVELLDIRFTVGCTTEQALRSLRVLADSTVPASTEFDEKLRALADDSSAAPSIADRLAHFERELSRSGRTFEFSDCSLGNLVFAGCFVQTNRDMNAAIADYCALMGLPEDLIENVTDGTNAYLVGIDQDGHVLGTEAEIVDANRRNRIDDIYLIDHVLSARERAALAAMPRHEVERELQSWSKPVRPNPRVLARIAQADLIVYAPGTQHSSLYPSYLTPGLGPAIAQNLRAVKLMITNLHADADIADSSAIDLVERAVYYLTERRRRHIPTPCLVTHFLLNDPAQREDGAPYIPLGAIDTLEDPRLVRIGNYEDAATGRHNAAKLLTPFVESFLAPDSRPRLAVVLHGTQSHNKIVQTMVEMIREGIGTVPVSITVFYDSGEDLDASLLESLPFAARNVRARTSERGSFAPALDERRFDYVMLFDSSGMYRGGDIVSLASSLADGRLDAVWGSRRLSMRDIHESYRMRYRKRPLLGALSYAGSHVLGAMYLLLYGRHIADTLSGVRAVRTAYARVEGLENGALANQRMLSLLLRERADVLEVPIQFFSLSPEKARRTTAFEGLRALGIILWSRIMPAGRPRVERTIDADGVARPTRIAASGVSVAEGHLETAGGAASRS